MLFECLLLHLEFILRPCGEATSLRLDPLEDLLDVGAILKGRLDSRYHTAFHEFAVHANSVGTTTAFLRKAAVVAASRPGDEYKRTSALPALHRTRKEMSRRKIFSTSRLALVETSPSGFGGEVTTACLPTLSDPLPQVVRNDAEFLVVVHHPLRLGFLELPPLVGLRFPPRTEAVPNPVTDVAFVV